MASMLGASALVFSAPVTAQAAPEEIVVTGEYGQAPDSVKSLSQSVSYADLDLSTEPGRDELRHRVSLTARFLCNKLGESGASSSITPSCQQETVRNAMKRVGTIEANFGPRGTTWVKPNAWQSPYPADWRTQYPLTD
jgi:UrcA family protein